MKKVKEWTGPVSGLGYCKVGRLEVENLGGGSVELYNQQGPGWEMEPFGTVQSGETAKIEGDINQKVKLEYLAEPGNFSSGANPKVIQMPDKIAATIKDPLHFDVAFVEGQPVGLPPSGGDFPIPEKEVGNAQIFALLQEIGTAVFQTQAMLAALIGKQ